MKWKTKNGVVIDVKDMKEQHIKNCIAMLKRKNAEGVPVLIGNDLDDAFEDLDYDFYDGEIEMFQDELLRRLNEN